MEVTLFSLIAIGGIIIGIIADRFWRHLERKELQSPKNPLPKEVPSVSENERLLLELYLGEWEVIIKTQMHFNDLILRFRCTTLTAFVTLVGAVVAIQKFVTFSVLTVSMIVGIPITLWLTAFLIDFFYYHRLLLGSVAQAMKFDNSELCRRYGLFGMSSCIKEHVQPPTSKVLVILFYAIPFLVGAILLVMAYIFGWINLPRQSGP